MFLRFALCLVPAIAAYLLIYLLTSNNMPSGVSENFLVGLTFALVGIGAVYCAVCLARRTFRSIEGPGGSRWILTILTFIGVVIGYVGLVFAGCCGVMIVGSNFA